MEDNNAKTHTEKEFSNVIHDIHESLSGLFGTISNIDKIKNKLIGDNLKDPEGKIDAQEPNSVYTELLLIRERLHNANNQLYSINADLSKYL